MPLEPPTTLTSPPCATIAVPTMYLRVADISVSFARKNTQKMIGELVEEEHLADVLLCVSELVTNAIRVARAYVKNRDWSWLYSDTPVRLDIDCRDRWTRLDVRDPDRNIPVPSTTGPLAESGRGLLIVDMVAADVWPTVHPDCKVMHAVIAMPGVELTADELAEARR